MFGTKGLGLHVENNFPIYLIIGLFFTCMTKHVHLAGKNHVKYNLDSKIYNENDNHNYENMTN